MNVIGLGIDTTFDDTSVAILRGKYEILAKEEAVSPIRCGLKHIL